MDQARVKADTERAKNQALADLRRGRLETEMTGRIRKAWAQLDEATDEIVRLTSWLNDPQAQARAGLGDHEQASYELALEKAKAMGKAEILALIMPVPLNTPEAVSREAGKRWQARQRGQKYETPGLRLVAGTVLDDVEGRPEFT